MIELTIFVCSLVRFDKYEESYSHHYNLDTI